MCFASWHSSFIVCDPFSQALSESPSQPDPAPKRGVRAVGRQLALQTLYQWRLRGDDFVDEVRPFLQEQTEDRHVRAFALELAQGCREHLAQIDAEIARVARHWDLARMAVIDVTVLRMAVFEMMFRPDIPPKVSISEAVRLAKKFSTAESGAFVNGILDALMARLSAGASGPEREIKGQP